MKDKMKCGLFAVLSATVLLFMSCHRQQRTNNLAAYIDTLSLRKGDLIFREGRSAESAMVMALDRHNYSHVGLLFNTKNGWKVVHAVPGESDNNTDTVKSEPISAYLQSDRCAKAKIVRVPCKACIAQKAVQYALHKIGFPFDDKFDMADTTKFYCTELVWRAYLSAGIDISKGRRHNINVLGLRKTSLLPSDITMGNTIKSINLE